MNITLGPPASYRKAIAAAAGFAAVVVETSFPTWRWAPVITAAAAALAVWRVPNNPRSSFPTGPVGTVTADPVAPPSSPSSPTSTSPAP